ncbi:hypothetical protein PMAYCL1PPCAC_19981 [Pristionchus mayeri]|uniref:Uncharacterized protein n=1 Tax=Pristionchus mayeri TaxID=1317129 RepID=A0AAN5I3P8_9BILA|nr:hypothetical protein PMAYCL1PPCAC_19981 [Pristionchus mayeri]
MDGATRCTQRKYSTANPVIFLLSLSSIVRTMHIFQPPVTGIDRCSNYFLGHYDFDWASIFLDMFSRKLDKLRVQNSAFPRYLPDVSADMLIAHLPELGKRIWFECSSDNYPYGLQYILHDHAVQAEPSFVRCGSLSIKHSLRVKEPFSR